jgi:hypothetical protein
VNDHWDRAAHAEFVLKRARALTIRCAYCNAQVGEPCVSRLGLELAKQPAHIARLRDVA